MDYTQAFLRVPLDDPVYMWMPQGWYADANGNLRQHKDPRFQDHNHFIQLKCNLYECKQAARNWFQHLTQGLLAEGLKDIKVDFCLFIWQDCLVVIFTDDCLIFAYNDRTINELISNLSHA